MSFNKILILGNLGKKPETRYLPSGKSTAQFSVATSRKWKDEGGNVHEETEWHNIVAFGRLAEICSEYLDKGSQVFIEGRIRTRSWTDNAGGKHYRTEVIAEGLRMLGGKKAKADKPAAPLPHETQQSDARQPGDEWTPDPNSDEPPF